MSKDIQEKLISAIEVIVNGMIKDIDYTSSKIGVVKNVDVFDCVVEISGGEYECKLPRHLHTHVKEKDIVVVQDLHNNNSKRFIIAKL